MSPHSVELHQAEYPVHRPSLPVARVPFFPAGIALVSDACLAKIGGVTASTALVAARAVGRAGITGVVTFVIAVGVRVLANRATRIGA